MNSVPSTVSRNPLREHFILTAVLVAALLCRMSLTSAGTNHSELASDSAATKSAAVLDAK